MKRTVLILLALLTVFGCVACGTETVKDMDVCAEVKAIAEEYALGGKHFYSNGDGYGAFDEDLILSYYGDATGCPDFSTVEAYGVIIDQSKPTKPVEFGIFKLNSNADKELFTAYLKARVNAEIQNAVAYPDRDVSGYKTAIFGGKGNYIWYICVGESNADINSKIEGKL